MVRISFTIIFQGFPLFFPKQCLLRWQWGFPFLLSKHFLYFSFDNEDFLQTKFAFKRDFASFFPPVRWSSESSYPWCWIRSTPKIYQKHQKNSTWDSLTFCPGLSRVLHFMRLCQNHNKRSLWFLTSFCNRFKWNYCLCPLCYEWRAHTLWFKMTIAKRKKSKFFVIKTSLFPSIACVHLILSPFPFLTSGNPHRCKINFHARCVSWYQKMTGNCATGFGQSVISIFIHSLIFIYLKSIHYNIW